MRNSRTDRSMDIETTVGLQPGDDAYLNESLEVAPGKELRSGTIGVMGPAMMHATDAIWIHGAEYYQVPLKKLTKVTT